MAKYKVPVVWQVVGYVEVEAEDEAHACSLALHAPLPDDGEYVSESMDVDDLQEVEVIE